MKYRLKTCVVDAYFWNGSDTGWPDWMVEMHLIGEIKLKQDDNESYLAISYCGCRLLIPENSYIWITKNGNIKHETKEIFEQMYEQIK